MNALPEKRCDACDNGVELDWLHCPYCGWSQTDAGLDDAQREIGARDRANAEYARLRSALSEAVEAMKPFAEEADDYDGEGDDREADYVGLWIGTRKHNVGHAHFSLGHLRRAREFITRHSIQSPPVGSPDHRIDHPDGEKQGETR